MDGEVGCRRRSRRDTIDGYEAFFGFWGLDLGTMGGLGMRATTRLVYNTGFGMRTHGLDWTVCGLYDGVGVCL